MKAFWTAGKPELKTKGQRRLSLPWMILFGKGLNGDRGNTASGAGFGSKANRDERGGNGV
jgi:hypothetical protein